MSINVQVLVNEVAAKIPMEPVAAIPQEDIDVDNLSSGMVCGIPVIFYNPNIHTKLSKDMIIGIIAHELGHIYHHDLEMPPFLFSPEQRVAIEHRADVFVKEHGFAKQHVLADKYLLSKPEFRELEAKAKALGTLDHPTEEARIKFFESK
jgi:hypothetical protein